MYNGKQVSLKNIMWRIASHPLMKDINYEDAAMYAIEAINLIGAPLTFTNKVTRPPIKVDDFKATLPSDLKLIRGVKMHDTDIALKYATNIYHDDKCKEDFGENCYYDSDYTYTVQSNVITTSFEEGLIVISYQALPLDKEGYPMIPDDQKVKEAIRYFIMYCHLEGLYDLGKIPQRTFYRIEQNKNWYIGAAQSSMQMQGMDHLQSTMNAVNRLLINNREHSRAFKYLQQQETNVKYR